MGEANLLPLPSEFSFLDGCLFTTVMGSAYAACERAHVTARDRVLITGLGPLGVCASLLSRSLGADVTGCDFEPQARARAEEAGVHHVFDMAAPLQTLQTYADTGFDAVLECTGTSTGIELALRAAKHNGRVALLSPSANTVPLGTAFDLIQKRGLCVMGIVGASTGQIQDSME
eukprot:Colp12_sorted_trinity150504_noHs@26019